MARLTDPEILSCYCNALANWKYHGFVAFTKLAQDWLQRELGGMSPRAFAEILYLFVQGGGEVDQVVETRPEYTIYSHHYDLRPTVNGRMLYVETRLDYRDPSDPDDPIVSIVNIHTA
jgi:hypothetical protein